MEARRRRRFAPAAILVIAVVVVAAASAVLSTVLLPGASGRRSLSIARAETAARGAVLAHRSYRQIASTRTGLVTRSCWRAGGGVRCSLYAVAANPCALTSDSGRICAQALWERRWLVEVRRGRHGTAAHILKISSGPSASGS
jgi:hypothetical protein